MESWPLSGESGPRFTGTVRWSLALPGELWFGFLCAGFPVMGLGALGMAVELLLEPAGLA